MSRHKSLRAAAIKNNDEFYTLIEDIELELKHYGEFLKGKSVYCNCDDPYKSNFVKYFVKNFNNLGLTKLAATCYAGADSQLDLFADTGDKLKAYKVIITEVDDTATHEEVLANAGVEVLYGSGSFDSDECIELLQDADVVVTNPPFSLFKSFIDTVVSYGKDFVVIGNTNALLFDNIFRLFKDGKVHTGYTNFNAGMFFEVPDDYTKYTKLENGVKYAQVISSCWYTSLPIRKAYEWLELTCEYSPDKYPKYHNFDAINVDKVVDIPKDYEGFIGVPVTFLDKYNPEQFELIGILSSTAGSEIQAVRNYENAYLVREDGRRERKYNLNINALLLHKEKPKGKYYIADGVDGYLTSCYARVLIRRR